MKIELHIDKKTIFLLVLIMFNIALVSLTYFETTIKPNLITVPPKRVVIIDYLNPSIAGEFLIKTVKSVCLRCEIIINDISSDDSQIKLDDIVIMIVDDPRSIYAFLKSEGNDLSVDSLCERKIIRPQYIIRRQSYPRQVLKIVNEIGCILKSEPNLAPISSLKSLSRQKELIPDWSFTEPTFVINEINSKCQDYFSNWDLDNICLRKDECNHPYTELKDENIRDFEFFECKNDFY